MYEIKISIIVPVYNGEKYIRPLMESIAAQTERDFELIVVDDGSQDGGIKIVNEYKDRIPRLTVLSQSNSGVSAARNKGISAAKGEYFCFCDADDVISPDYLAVFSKMIDHYSPDVVVCGYQVFYGENANIKALSGFPNSTDLYKEYGERTFDALSLFGLQAQIWNKLYKTSLVNLFHIKFSEGNGYGEDMFFNWKVFLASKCTVKADCDLYYYRMIEGSASVRYHPHLYENYKAEYRRMLDFAKQTGVDRDSIQRDIYKNLAERIPALVRMAVRRKQGIPQAFRDIKATAEDALMKDSVDYVLKCKRDSVKPETIRLAGEMKDKKIRRLWFYGFKSELRVSLGRKLGKWRKS